MKKSVFKKIFSAMLMMVMMSFTACSTGTEQSANTTSTTSAQTEAQTTQATSADTTAANTTAKPQEDKVKISFALWDEVQAPVFEKIIEEFEKSHSNIDVELQLTPWSQYWVKLDAAAGSGNAADVMWMNVFLPKYADANVVMPIDELVTKENIDLNQWTKSMIDLYTYNGKLYGLPKGQDVVDVYYNKEIFDKYGVEYPKDGWTWEDMKTIGAQLRDAIKEKGGSEYPLVMELDSQPSYYNFIHQEGGFIISPDGTTNGFDKPETIKAMQDVTDLMTEGVMAEYKVLSDTKGTDLFLSQKAAMVFAGSWKASVIDESSFSQNVGVVQMPKKSSNNASVLGGLCYVINATSKHPDEAWEFTKYLAGAESNKMQAEGKIDMPAFVGVQDSYVPNFKNIDAKVIIETTKNSFPYPSHKALAEFDPIISENAQAIFSGQVSAEEGCKTIYEQVQEILDANK